MKEIIFIKIIGGLKPASEEEADKLDSFKLGSTIKCEISTVINGKFRRKWWALARIAFNYWVEVRDMPEYKGQLIQPNFDRFRGDLTILAGYWHPVTAINGTVRPEADSISYARMTDEIFEKFYSATIDAILKHIYGSGMSEKDLREAVEKVIGFV